MAGQGAPAAEPLRSGSGGRWLLWPVRIVLKAAILIIGYRGISAIALNETPSSGGIAVSGEPAWLPAPTAASVPDSPTAASSPAAQRALLGGAVSFRSIASRAVPPGGATRGIANRVLSGQVSQGPPQFSAIYDMSVVDQPRGRWYVREIRASTQPMGTQ